MHNNEIDRFLRQPKTILSDPSSVQAHQDAARYLHHICQSSQRKDDDVLYAPKQEKRTEHLLRAHCVIQPFAFKNKETVFYNAIRNPAVTHILNTLPKHDLHEVKILIIQYFIILSLLKNLLAFIQALLTHNIKIDYMRNHFN